MKGLMNLRLKFVRTAFLAFVLTAIMALQPVAVHGAGQAENIEYIDSVMDMIKEKYSGILNDRQLLDGAIKGIFNSMDPYTTFYTKEETRSFFNELEGNYEGIGVVLRKDGDYVIVDRVISESPAEKIGIISSDVIVEVDGQSTQELSAADAAAIIKGQAGTYVNLTVERASSDSASGKTTLNVRLQREILASEPGAYWIDGSIGNIKLDVFNSNSADLVDRALNEFDSKGISNVILDLRDNPGGEVEEAVEIAARFVPSGPITRLDFKEEDRMDIEFKSKLEKNKYNLAVLVNNKSASASEIVAGAIQDSGAGTLVGTKTFGKARVQSFIPLLTPEAFIEYKDSLNVELVDAYELMEKHGVNPSDEEILGWTKITTGEYLTRNGRMIDQKGLQPDIYVEDDAADIQYRTAVHVVSQN